jgi:O-acetyl-ADP-ribose deacetylase (regulator of RNase III)
MVVSHFGYFTLLFVSLMITCMGFGHLMANSEIASEKVAGRKLILKIGDLTQEKADVIVNAANGGLVAGGGVCGAIRKAAGPAVFQECQQILAIEGITSIEDGEARMTSAGLLAPKGIKAIIHAVGPQGKNEEALRSAYRNSLMLAENAGYASIAFPSISTGIFNYPIEEAAATAIDEIRLFLEGSITHLQEVRFVFLDPDKSGDETAWFYKEALGK